MSGQASSSPPSNRNAKVLTVVAALVALAVVGILFIRSQAGGPVVDVDALEREEDARFASLEVLGRVEELIQNGKIEEARRSLQQVTEADPNFYLGHLMLGYVFMQQGKLNLAAQATQRAYKLEPNDPAVNYQMGQAESISGNVESAIDHLARAIRLRADQNPPPPPAPEYHVTLADALARAGRPDQAKRQMTLALDADRDQAIAAAVMAGPDAQVALARVLFGRKETAEAAQLFAQAAALRPDRADWQSQAARAYYVQGKFDQAASFIQRAVDLDPSNAAYVRLKQRIGQKSFGTPSIEIAEPESDQRADDDQEPPAINLFNP